jgi:hypothetical protein
MHCLQDPKQSNVRSVTNYPRSKPDQKYARRTDRQIYIQKNKVYI